MWTCGIAIATQQEMLATHSITVSVLVDSRRSTRGGGALRGCAASPRRSGRASSSSTSVIVTAQKMPIAIWVVRQPDDCTPQLTSGGQIVPPT